jgi:hypothetical protein
MLAEKADSNHLTLSGAFWGLEDIWETGISPFRRIGETFPKWTLTNIVPEMDTLTNITKTHVQPTRAGSWLLRRYLSDRWGSNTPMSHFPRLTGASTRISSHYKGQHFHSSFAFALLALHHLAHCRALQYV